MREGKEKGKVGQNEFWKDEISRVEDGTRKRHVLVTLSDDDHVEPKSSRFDKVRDFGDLRSIMIRRSQLQSNVVE